MTRRLDHGVWTRRLDSNLETKLVSADYQLIRRRLGTKLVNEAERGTLLRLETRWRQGWRQEERSWRRGRTQVEPHRQKTQARPRQPRLQLGWTRLEHQAAFEVSLRQQASRSVCSIPSSPSTAAIRTACSPQGWTRSTPGEQCRTQVPTSAGSGDLLPTLDEETAPPLVQDQRAAFLCLRQCYTVLVIVVTNYLIPEQTMLATKPTIKCLMSIDSLLHHLLLAL